MNTTATTQDRRSAIPTTWKIEMVYSPALDLASPTGRKPAAVISVPVSMGKAVAVKAKVAARVRSQPSSSLSTIISTAMIASSTSRPSAMINAPSEMRCRSMPSAYIARKVIARTSGIDSATTMPVRQPSERKLTASTMAIASARLLVNSWIDSCTTSGWLETAWISTPTGMAARTRATAASSSLPMRITSPPSRMAMAIPIVSLPLKCILLTTGST